MRGLVRLKVYSGTVWRGRRLVNAIVAAPSQTQAAALLNVSVYLLRKLWRETDDELLIAQALERPGQVLLSSCTASHTYRPQQLHDAR